MEDKEIEYMINRKGTSYAFAKLAPVGAGNGVAKIANSSTKVDVSEMRVGDAATFKSTRTDHKGKDGEFDHIGIISNINRDNNNNITSFDVIHASSSKGVIEQTYDMTKKEGMSNYNELRNVYQWDTPGGESSTSTPSSHYSSDIFKPTNVYEGPSSR